MKEDIVLLAEAILAGWRTYDDGDYSPTYYTCSYCWAHHPTSYEKNYS
jgi:hypothetical protein